MHRPPRPGSARRKTPTASAARRKFVNHESLRAMFEAWHARRWDDAIQRSTAQPPRPHPPPPPSVGGDHRNGPLRRPTRTRGTATQPGHGSRGHGARLTPRLRNPRGRSSRRSGTPSLRWKGAAQARRCRLHTAGSRGRRTSRSGPSVASRSNARSRGPRAGGCGVSNPSRRARLGPGGTPDQQPPLIASSTASPMSRRAAEQDSTMDIHKGLNATGGVWRQAVQRATVANGARTGEPHGRELLG